MSRTRPGQQDEAEVMRETMREYDDENIRLYTPVLQRVIVLLAVIIAVPVVMWTITTVVRTYFAPPKVPTFQRMTENQPSGTLSDASQTAAAPAPAASQGQSPAPAGQMADAGTTASDAHLPLLDIKKPVDGPSQANAPAAAQTAAAVQPSAAQPMPTAPAPSMPVPVIQPLAAPAPVQPMTADAVPPMATVVAAPAASPSPTPATSSTGPLQSSAAAAAPAAPRVAAPASQANNIAWPNPNTNSPPTVGTDNGATGTAAVVGPAVATQQPPASSDATAEALPPGEPIAGQVPLPPRKPMLFAMVQTTVPLPRPRPADAPAAAPITPVEAPASGYDPGMEPGHY